MLPSGTWSRMRSDALFLIETDPQHTSDERPLSRPKGEGEINESVVHPRKTKLMMGLINKSDKLAVHGLNRLQRNGTLTTVWISPWVRGEAIENRHI